MRKRAAGLGAIVSLAVMLAPAFAAKSPVAAAPPRPGAKSEPSSGFAKTRDHGSAAAKHASRHGTAAPKHATGHRAAAAKHAAARTKPSAGKNSHSRPLAAHVRPVPAGGPRSAPALQFHGGAAGLFAGWPFTRPGSPGRFGGEHARRQYGGFVGWFGPVFWPYAYDDMFAYVFWPLDSFDYGEAFWAFAYDDLFQGIFWAEAEPDEPEPVLVAAEANLPSSEDRSRAGVLGLDGRSREFAQICGERTPGLSQWPILRIAQSVGLAREQRAALKDLRNAVTEAVRVLKAACPVETPTTPLGRLEAMQERVAAILQALELLRAPIGQFYFSLTDAQKARFQTAASPALHEDAAAGSASGENELVPQICTDHPAGLSEQTVDRLEAAVRTTDAQRGALEGLRAATARAAKVLRDACPAGAPVAPPERLAAMQQRLGAMVAAASLVRPALQGFYDAMDDAQKGRLNAVGRPVGRPANRGSD